MPAPVLPTQERRARTWVNWALALLTAPGAALVMILATGALVSTAACSTTECPNLGPSGFVFGVLFYGAPVVSAVVILASFRTAGRRWGVVVPAIGWVLLLADLAAVSLAFR